MTSATAEKATTITKRPSRAARSAARNGKPASTAKASTARRTTKPAAKSTKPATKVTTKAAPKGPSDRQLRQDAAQVLLDMAGELVRTWDAARTGVPKATAYESIRQCMGYTPHACKWPAALGPRDVGRPAPVAKAK